MAVAQYARVLLPLRREPRRAWDPVLSNGRALLLVLPLLVLLVSFVFYPLVKLAIDSFTTGSGAHNYIDVLTLSSTQQALITTIVSSIVVTTITMTIGTTLAWHLCTMRHAWARTMIWLAVLAPFWMGTVVKNYAIVLLASHDGPLNDILAAVGIGRVQILYTTTAVVIGIVYTMVPYAVFSLYGVFAGIDQSLVLAARSMGASRIRALATVAAPLAMPGILASGALVFSISVGFYVTPVLLGGGQSPFVATVIQNNIFTFYNYGFASAASVILLIVAVAILGLTFALVGRERLMRAVA